MSFVNVAIAARVFHPFTYRVPDNVSLVPGMRVVVPFHRRYVVGVVLELTDRPPQGMESASFKPLERILDEVPTLSPALLQLITWMAKHYCSPIGEVCRLALPRRLMELKSRTPKRVASPQEIFASEKNVTRLHVNTAQDEALKCLVRALSQKKPPPFLLHGITGSGKTEIYLRLFEHVLGGGGQAILLVPEIGLTPQLASRVINRFGDDVAIYHSGLTDAQRFEQWKRMKAGKVSIVVGTRSALFAPFPNLKAIVLDEEHDTSYKQEDGTLYHARDVAIQRAELEQALVVLGSATPSLESFHRAQQGTYHLLSLPTRVRGATLPRVDIVDMRRRRSSHVLLSEELAAAIDTTLLRKEQVLLFLNRRGFAHFLLCESCGHVFLCPNCNISLTHHLHRDGLLCHYCDYFISMPTECHACRAKMLASMGGGTERLEAELRDFFPNARTARLDRDTSTRKQMRQHIFQNMNAGTIDILIGTQLVAKGHDFPLVTLVGILSAEGALCLPDFRSSERAFQLVTQVAGRAGRAEKPGRVIVQTYHPDHFSLVHAATHDFRAFFTQECEARETLHYPPFSRLTNIRFSGNDEKRVDRAAHIVADWMRTTWQGKEGIHFVGPAPSPFEKVRGKYRWQFLLKAASHAYLAPLLQDIHAKTKSLLPAGVRLTIDIDPVSLL